MGKIIRYHFFVVYIVNIFCHLYEIEEKYSKNCTLRTDLLSVLKVEESSFICPQVFFYLSSSSLLSVLKRTEIEGRYKSPFMSLRCRLSK